jgi:hypothetical protein
LFGGRMEYSTLLKKNLKIFYNKNNKNSFELLEGCGSVIVSAPHSVEQIRNGKIKFAEYQTGAITRILHEKIGCPVIYKTKNCNDDANYDDKSDYRDFLIQYIKKNDIKLLMDLHQMAPRREMNIDIGTGRGKNILQRYDLLEKIITFFNNNGVKNIMVDEIFDATYKNTVSAHVSSSCSIPCFQIEINSKLVSDKYDEYNIDSIIKSLLQIIEYMNMH